MNKHTLTLGRFSAVAARHPWPVIVTWVLAMLLAASLAAPKLWQVTTNDTSNFLPTKYESVKSHSLRTVTLRAGQGRLHRHRPRPARGR